MIPQPSTRHPSTFTPHLSPLNSHLSPLTHYPPPHPTRSEEAEDAENAGEGTAEGEEGEEDAEEGGEEGSEEGEGGSVADRDVPRSPEDLERLAAYEGKNKGNKGGKKFREHLSTAKDRKVLADRLRRNADTRGERIAMTAVALLVFAMAGFYFFHRRNAMSAAFGKKS